MFGYLRELSRVLSWRQSADPGSTLDPATNRRYGRNSSASISLRGTRRRSRFTPLAPGRARDKLLPRLDENEQVLIETYNLVAVAAAEKRRIEPAAEWLLDNFYLIEEQIRDVRRLLPPSYSRELPV